MKKAVLHPIGKNEVLCTYKTRYYLDNNYVPENIKRGIDPAECPCPACVEKIKWLKEEAKKAKKGN